MVVLADLSLGVHLSEHNDNIVIVVVLDKSDLLAQIPRKVGFFPLNAIPKVDKVFPTVYSKSPGRDMLFELPQLAVGLLHFLKERLV